MTVTTRQALIVSLVLLLQTITLSNAKHHHKRHGQQCLTAWSSTQAHYSINSTNINQAKVQQTRPTATNSTGPPSNNTTTDPSKDSNKYQFNVTGIPWQYEGKPIESIADSHAHVISVTPPINQTLPAGQSPPKDGDQLGFPCLNAGVLFSCSKCDTILTGRDCYKKIGEDQLDIVNAGHVKCDQWYTRSGYGEGGGVTMCGTKSGDVFQCSSDKGLSQCEPCVELGTTSPS